MATFRKRGTKWQAQVRRKDLPPLSRSFHLKSDAEAWAREIEVQADRGEAPVPSSPSPSPSPSPPMTLAALVERYRDSVVPAKRGRSIETIILNAFLRTPLAKLNLSEVTAQRVAEYRDERLQSVRPATINRELGILRHALGLAHREWGVTIRSNPFAEVRRPRNDHPRERRLLPGELERLREASKACRNKEIPLIIELAVETAMRRGEILSIRWANVDLVRRTLHLPVTKNGHPRTIPLTARAVATLSDLRSLRGGVTGECLTLVSPLALRLSWVRITKRAGIEGLRFHDLRHEAVSRFFEIGLSTPEVALISGHRDARMLMRYTHLRPEDVAKKLTVLGANCPPDVI
jgi:integrase